jgi:uroporphyrinogen-III synthase
MSLRSIAGWRVLVTRAVHQASKLSDGLRAIGIEPIEVPLLEIQVPASFESLDHALRQLDRYDWMILTSANTVHAITQRASQLQLKLVQPTHLKLAAVGEGTAVAARKAGLQVDFVPENYVAESLLQGLPDEPAGKRILLARAAVARDVIPDALRAAGATVNVVDAYQTVFPANAPKQLRHALADGIDAATFTSSSSATHLAEAAARAGLAFPFAGVKAVSIGPITSQTMRELGWEPADEADPSDISGLIVAVARVLGLPAE